MTLIQNPKFRLFLSAASTWALMSMALEGAPFSLMSFAGHMLAASYALVPLIAIGYALYFGQGFMQSMLAQHPSTEPNSSTNKPIIEAPEETPVVNPTPSPNTKLNVTSSSTPIIEEIADNPPVVVNTSEPAPPFLPLVESDISPVKNTQAESTSEIAKEVDSTPDTPPLVSDSEGQELDYLDFGCGFDDDDCSDLSSEVRTKISDNDHHSEEALNTPFQLKATNGPSPIPCPAPNLPQPLPPAPVITDPQPSKATSEPSHTTRQRQRYLLPFMESIAYRVKNFPRERFVTKHYVPENFKKPR